MKMTPEQMRDAITEKCGWVYYDGWHHPTIEGDCPPDYTEDLNACAEMEKAFSHGEGYYQPGGWGYYKQVLAEVCAEQHPINATAAQRAEAFCRVFFPERFEK